MADDPKTDMSRYYYPPGTTEPQLRLEIAEAESRATQDAKPTKAEEKAEEKTEESRKSVKTK